MVIEMPYGKRVERTLLTAGLAGLLGGAYVIYDNITSLNSYDPPQSYERIFEIDRRLAEINYDLGRTFTARDAIKISDGRKREYIALEAEEIDLEKERAVLTSSPEYTQAKQQLRRHGDNIIYSTASIFLSLMPLSLGTANLLGRKNRKKSAGNGFGESCEIEEF